MNVYCVHINLQVVKAVLHTTPATSLCT